jgi:hypothetical protein
MLFLTAILAPLAATAKAYKSKECDVL